ncbi:unnamed protein product [Mytilus edulis]|uniref:Uncharacterized protein n=1 Tax=Mytilus edulis TaxID=6550 RepID=A0A8S3URK8_MYTED|nr:unnamed protein product [Mytilus edulis]
MREPSNNIKISIDHPVDNFSRSILIQFNESHPTAKISIDQYNSHSIDINERNNNNKISTSRQHSQIMERAIHKYQDILIIPNHSQDIVDNSHSQDINERAIQQQQDINRSLDLLQDFILIHISGHHSQDINERAIQQTNKHINDHPSRQFSFTGLQMREPSNNSKISISPLVDNSIHRTSMERAIQQQIRYLVDHPSRQFSFTGHQIRELSNNK